MKFKLFHSVALALTFMSSLFVTQNTLANDGPYPALELVCIDGNEQDCSQDQFEDPVHYRQILVMPTGYEGKDKQKFMQDFRNYVKAMSTSGSNVYSQKYKDQFLYFAYFISGETFSTNRTTVDGRVNPHPIRDGYGITLNNDLVHERVRLYRELVQPLLKPFAVVVLFNTDKDVTANAKVPTFLQRDYGIILLTGDDASRKYLASHETAHGGLNFLDEYVEGGFENMNIRTLDLLSSFTAWGKGFGGIADLIEYIRGGYRIKISEILAANGSENMEVTKYPSRVATEGYTPNEFEYEGGMFFGRGTYHDSGNNLMNSSRVTRGPDDSFAFDHSQSQKDVIEQFFESPEVAPRPNDRIRNAGPTGRLKWTWGKKTHLLLFDGDKHHRWHPTKSYEVQVGWYERDWSWCKAGGWFPHPCVKKTWKSVNKTIYPETVAINLKEVKLYGLAKFATFLACKMGIGKLIAKDDAMVERFCSNKLEDVVNSFVPTLEWVTPYQQVEVPVSQWMTDYYWRFSTQNGTLQSGQTGWNKFFRVW